MADGLWRTWQFDRDPPAQDTVAHVIAALGRFPDHHDRPLRPARLWLAEQNRSSDRGWHASWYHSGPYALLEVGRALGYGHPRVQRAADRLAADQNSDGGWGREPGEPSCASATGLALAALTRRDRQDERALAAGVSFLARTRRQDGTWPGVPEMLGPRPLLTHMPMETQAFTAMGLTAVSLHGGRYGTLEGDS
jgi:squalene-hopene/tetraprenyl-beta-curcumene cyclase